MEKILEQVLDTVIIGGGPAGTAAGVYAARKQLKTVLIAESFGGQSVVSADIKNWIGTPSISGADLAESFKAHLQEYVGDWFSVVEARVASITEEGGVFTVMLANGDTLSAKTILLATGSTRRKLAVPGADLFEHKGLTYCASCDGPLFAGKDVAVIGGGNAGFETAAQLLAYAKSVTLLHRSAEYSKADAITVKKVLSHPNMTGITEAETATVFGESLVQGLTYKKDSEEHTLAVEGIFVEIGLIPSTDIVKDLVTLDPVGRVSVDPKTQQSSCANIWAAGDCTDGLFHQNNIAAGDAVKAVEHIYLTLHTQ
ncbi:MAG: FAD-dependent oxidoreductase [Candidatus Kaiserbacteria bacterium]|nr:FAD-dependent oxidoreductase [Candidatus Kaiserbacteria bacterium]